MSAAFKKAAEDSKKLLAKPSNDELLELYGPFLSTPPCAARRQLPDDMTWRRVQGKAKKNAWQKVVDEGISAETAQERYVALVEQLKTKYGFDENKVPDAVGN
ncbi:acyl CoA binding protein [Beauveria bassiana ARSEF 2860]|uniref:Acyl CoA binding protein n=1 Tax=Beauveria bassiana (strain ARSEF 2860) TaxID=655819 RepID=J4ULX7_BEAB2|nr:acyl CoA binding protein [Beauveria bassiana ARSEF 2860]EJP65717.1 acyl CoA binding protein [Beauveria bassiana ARSEF 2860]